MIWRIVWRIVSRVWSFAVRGMLVTPVTGAVIGVLLGAGLDVIDMASGTPAAGIGFSGIQDVVVMLVLVGVPLGLLAYGPAGAIASRRNDYHLAFKEVWRRATLGGLVGTMLMTLCSVTLLPLLGWATNNAINTILSIPASTPRGPFWTQVFAGYLFGAIAGFIIGTFTGALCGATGKSLWSVRRGVDALHVKETVI
jgi:hypothetical protein